ncbi:MAG: sugar porter family MFS transporter [Deltaproteobacteria bacterium]|jgi:SP family sugar:H+ symporter-like MFS transporter|nr:sugar porter family MFS transporter [Deltaproteobacteria bacterium]
MSEKATTNFAFIILITLVATIGGFLFGYDSGVINGTVDGLQKAFHSDSIGTGFNVASILLGCAAGAFFAGWLADKFGRRTILIVSSICFAASALGAGMAQSSIQFILVRVLGGLAVGAASVLAPAYISEVTPAKYRGTLSSIQQVAIITGLFASFLSNYILARVAGGSTVILAWGFEAWRWMFWVMLIPSVVFFFSLLFIPESPRFLVASRKKDKALAVLTRLMGAAAAQAKVDEIDASLVADHHRPKLTDILDSKRLFRPIVWVGIGLASFQQFVGINIVFYYGAVLWQSAGFSESQALLTNVISGGVSIVACFIATALIDRVGRKPLLLVGSVGMAVTLGTLAVVFATADTVGGTLHLTGAEGPIALVAANLYVMFFNVSWGPVMWVMLGEMFPNQIRGSGLAVSGLAQWLSNFGITMTFPILLTGIGLGGAYGLYTACAIISIFFILKFVHETKGKELEEMQG